MAEPSRRLRQTRPQFRVEGEDASALSADLISLETHADEQGLATLDARFLNLGVNEDGVAGFTHFGGQLLGLGKRLEVSAGDPEDEHLIFKGVITAVIGHFSQSAPPEIGVRAEDELFKLRLTRRTRLHESASDADIANRVAQDASLQADAQADGPTHTALLQLNQTDLGQLRERARAVDAGIAMADSTLQFRKRGPASGPPVQISRLNELLSFDVVADLAQQRREVQVHGWSVSDKSGIHETADRSAVDAELDRGDSGPAVLEQVGVEAVEHHSLDFPVTEEEARELARSLMLERARRFVVGKGVTSGHPQLQVGAEVELLDLGPWFTGRYRVVTLRHTYDQRRGLRTWFTATRPALGGGV